MTELEKLRITINDIDKDLVNLISRRIEIGKEVARAKKTNDSVFFQPVREQEVLQRIQDLNPGELSNVRLQNIFREIMGATLDIQHSLKVAYLGPKGSFTHQAALKKFGHSIALTPCNGWNYVFDLVQQKKVQYGILPIENSVEGMVNATLDNLMEHELNIYSEVHLGIHNQLLGFNKNLDDIKVVYSHPQPLGQCRKWLAANLPHVQFVETMSTSEGARLLAESQDKHTAAIASMAAAETYGLSVIESNIEDYHKNYTRFIIISNESAGVSKADRTSVLFAVSHKPGSLFEVLKPIHEAGLNMTSIESRPSPGESWNFYFYVDLLGHHSLEPLSSVLEEMKKNTLYFRVLGSYPIDQSYS